MVMFLFTFLHIAKSSRINRQVRHIKYESKETEVKRKGVALESKHRVRS